MADATRQERIARAHEAAARAADLAARTAAARQRIAADDDPSATGEPVTPDRASEIRLRR
ncbi:hypothetical protein [Actinoplanes sp. CA-252034]|uniref:hypothetical protein n=1 Tax=Actinoplanes sp. CA-252034 TaxID=3239906 RepID=UPI003D98C795